MLNKSFFKKVIKIVKEIVNNRYGYLFFICIFKIKV